MIALRFPGGNAATTTLSAACANEFDGTNTSITKAIKSIDVNNVFIINILSVEVYF
jgi:hypothetical protein